MKKLLLPLIFLLVGTGGGVGAAMFLAPPEDAHAAMDEHGPCGPLPEDLADPEPASLQEEVPIDPTDPAAGFEYARLNNQFIIPVVSDARVAALVVMSLSVEVVAGEKELVFAHEPRLRDALLQVMFDHANLGGFDGVFTASDNMGNLRAALRNVARQELGQNVTDVLVLDVVRQEVPG